MNTGAPCPILSAYFPDFANFANLDIGNFTPDLSYADERVLCIF
jgi:hypothetical protein